MRPGLGATHIAAKIGTILDYYEVLGRQGLAFCNLTSAKTLVATDLPSRRGADMANFLTWASDVLEKVDQSAASLSDTSAPDRFGR